MSLFQYNIWIASVYSFAFCDKLSKTILIYKIRFQFLVVLYKACIKAFTLLKYQYSFFLNIIIWSQIELREWTNNAFHRISVIGKFYPLKL
jgi:hypothetical protein